MIYYSYEMRLQNFEALRAILVKLRQFWLDLGGFMLQVRNWSILLIFFINMIHYSYEMRLQNFEALHAILVKLWQFWLDLGGFMLQVWKIDQFFCFFL